MGLFGSKNKSLVGLDIGSSSVKVCEIQTTGKGASLRHKVVKVGSSPIPADAIVDGDIMDSSAVAQAIRQAMGQLRIKNKDVAISLSGQQVMVKKVTFPLMSPAELAESVRWEAESFFPAGQGMDAYALDFDVIEERPQEGNMDVVLVACRKDKLESYVSCVAQAGCVPRVVDVDVFALQNSHEVNSVPGGPDEVAALVNLGSTFANLAMLVGRRAMFWRDITWGTTRYLDKLQEDWGVSREGAHALLAGQPAEGHTPDEVQGSLNAVSEAFGDELARTIDFFRSSFKVDRLDRIQLAGGGSMVNGLPEALKDRLRVPVERFNPFQGMDVDATVDPGALRQIGGGAAVAVGLALRQVGDR
ncbi:MAG TPA: type IV pilus assembly protein PilM [Holophagaceae bacterium]|nr:type IV pilus assembly protein PilM [Holophagaceae bacterium]